MKKSKTTHPTHSQAECGVWLDPVQLKGKVKQVIAKQQAFMEAIPLRLFFFFLQIVLHCSVY